MREECFGPHRLILGDCLEIMQSLSPVDHIIGDPPYEAFMHNAKSGAAGRKNYGSARRIRIDGNANPKTVDFASIDDIRAPFVTLAATLCRGWFIAFCTPEGVGKWADEINASPMKYKRACVWVKPDSTPQLNGQCPAMGAENFVCAWAGSGHSKWNAGGKRGVYTHLTNPPGREGTHPTEKPLRLMDELLTDFTNYGQTILDPFCGSGSTIISCARTGRAGIGIEQKREYFDLACRRLEAEMRQPRMFLEPVAKATQDKLL